MKDIGINKILNNNRGIGGFKARLQSEYLRRCEKNRSYSLRAFSKSLGISQGHLSRILSGQRPLTTQMIMRLGGRLNLSPQELTAFLTHLGLKDNYQILKEDVFCLVSDWYHFAILELIKTQNFEPTIKYVSKKLKININEAKIAVERLEKLGFIRIQREGWELLSRDNSFSNFKTTNAPKRKLQKQLLEKAMQAIDEVPLEDRENSSLTIACSREQLPEVKKMILEFKMKIDNYLENSEEKDSVYQLTVSMFPLTEKELK